MIIVFYFLLRYSRVAHVVCSFWRAGSLRVIKINITGRKRNAALYANEMCPNTQRLLDKFISQIRQGVPYVPYLIISVRIRSKYMYVQICMLFFFSFKLEFGNVNPIGIGKHNCPTIRFILLYGNDKN